VKPLLHALLALLLAGLQAALLRHLGGGSVTLVLPAVLLVHLALTAGLLEGAVGAAAVGYVLDVTAGDTKGLLTALGVGCFVLVRVIGAAVHVHTRAGFALLSGLAALALPSAAVALTRAVVGPELRPGWELLPRIALAALLTGLVAPLLQAGLRRLDAALGEETSDLAG
jgi:rod shape-determining protein MreD